MQLLRFDPQRHLVIPLPETRALRRVLHAPDFFIYWHRETKNWVAARWIHKAAGILLEDYISEQPPWLWPATAIDEIRYRNSNRYVEDMQRAAGDAAGQTRAFYRKADDDAAQFRDFKQSLIRRSNIHRRDDPTWALL